MVHLLVGLVSIIQYVHILDLLLSNNNQISSFTHIRLYILTNNHYCITICKDPDLTEKGIQEAEHAARLLLESGYEIDVVFTSRLKRAIRSTSAMLREMDMMYLPIYKSWRLNERNTGLLTGSSALETVKIFGETTVQAWYVLLENEICVFYF